MTHSVKKQLELRKEYCIGKGIHYYNFGAGSKELILKRIEKFKQDRRCQLCDAPVTTTEVLHFRAVIKNLGKA